MVTPMSNAPTTTNYFEDIARWDLPADRSEAAAKLARFLNYDVTLIPFFLPGKEYGVWTIGQAVEIAPRAIGFCGPDARRRANDWARDNMANGREGTWGYFCVWADEDHHEDTTAAFEDIMSARD
jgi:hypothetical protein